MQRIFTHDVVGFDLAGQRFVRHFGDPGTDLVVHARRINPPGFGEFGANAGVGDVLVAGEHIRQDAHITGALDVVLPAYRPHADVGAPEVAG